MKAEEVYAKLKNLIELNEGISKKTEIDDTNVSNKTTYSSEKIVKEIEALKSIQSLEYEGTDVTCENTLTSRTSDVIVKGQTYQNLFDVNSVVRNDNAEIVGNYICMKAASNVTTLTQYKKPKIKDNTVYTYIMDVIENSLSDSSAFRILRPETYGVANVAFLPREFTNGRIINKFTTNSSLAPDWNGEHSNFFISRNDITGSIKFSFILLEGDWTNKEVPASIIGIESAGEKENKISILSHGKNLVNPNKLFLNNSSIIKENGAFICPANVSWQAEKITGVDLSKPLYFAYEIKSDENIIIDTTNKSMLIRLDYVKTGGNVRETDIPIGTQITNEYTKLIFKNISLSNINIEQGINLVFRNGVGKKMYIRNITISNSPIYDVIPYQQDKKEILLPFEGGLKSLPNGVCDTIEQRNDGVYLVQRVKKETYVNGDENNNNYLTDKVNTYKPLETPTETKLNIYNLNLEVYENTTYITTDNAIQPTLSFKVPSNIGGIIQENAQNINKLYKINDEIIIPQLINNSADNINYQNSNYPLWTNVKKTLDGIIAKIDYIKPEITSFTSTAQAVYEVGQKISNIVFNWTTNKNVTTQTLTDCTIDANSRTATYTNEINSNKTFTLTIGDGQNTASKSISIAFRNKIYYGSAAIPSIFNSAFILGLSKKQFATSKSGSFSITVGSNEYGFIAFPSSFGTLTSVKIGGFDTDVTSCGNISFTNSSNGVATYSIYRTGRHSLGAITMVIN